MFGYGCVDYQSQIILFQYIFVTAFSIFKCCIDHSARCTKWETNTDTDSYTNTNPDSTAVRRLFRDPEYGLWLVVSTGTALDHISRCS